MKTVVSVSIGSSARDHEVQTEFLGEPFTVKRIGTDGNLAKAKELITQLDGQVAAIGLGGLDVYLYSGKTRYELQDGEELLRLAHKTPVVDGSGLKNTLEREAITFLEQDGRIPLRDRKVLMVCAMDRFGMAEALEAAGAQVVYGDVIFALGIDKPITSLEELGRYAANLLPQLCRLPIDIVYPTGKKQKTIQPTELTNPYYQEADIVGGDFLFIRKHLPDSLPGKVIITNTVTSADVEELRRRSVEWLVTTTPEFNGRSFGTNVMEAVLISILGKQWNEVQPEDYLELIRRLGFKPRIVRLQDPKANPEHN